MAQTKVKLISDGVIVQGNLHSSHGITTAHIGEGSNLYYTDARVDTRVGNLNTGNLPEGSNLYYTNARADARIAAASTSDLSEGTNLYYTDARADARVALIVDSSPATLNTLNELAAALGDDPNFATTTATSIGTKLPLAGGTLSGPLQAQPWLFRQMSSQVEYHVLDNGNLNGPSWKFRYDGTTSNRYVDFGFKDGAGNYVSGLKLHNNATVSWRGTDIINADAQWIGDINTSSFIQTGGIEASGNVTVGNSGNINIPTASSGNANLHFDGTDFKITSNSSSANLKLETSSTTRLTINSAGNAIFSGDVEAPRFDVGTTSTSIIQESNRMKFTNAIANDAGGFDFFTRNSGSTYINALTILGSGNVGIGVVPNAPNNGLIQLDVGDNGCGMTSRQNNELVLQANANYSTYAQAGKPATRLNLTNSGEFHFLNAPAGTAIGDTISFTERMRIASDGFVRIGNPSATNTYTPAQGYVAGISSPIAGGQTYLSLSMGGSALGNTGVAFGLDAGGASYYMRDNKPIRFYTNNTFAMTIAADGNVGIGQTAPGQKLVIGNYDSVANGTMRITALGGQFTPGTIRNSLEFQFPSAPYVNSGDAWRYSIGLNSAAGNQGNYGSDFVIRRSTRLGVTDNVDFLIDGTSGNVGIGTTTPSQKLEVSGNTYATGYAQASSALIGLKNGYATLGSNSTATGIALSRDFLPSSYPDLIITPSGNVGIGTASPSNSKLEVNGNIKAETTVGKFFSNVYTATTESQVDTLTASGNGLWEYSIKLNPNPAGSSAYADFYYGKVGLGGGYDGAVKTFLWYQEDQTAPRTLYGSGGGNKTLSWVMVSGGSEVTSVTHGASVTLRVKGFGGNAYNQSISIYLRRLA